MVKVVALASVLLSCEALVALTPSLRERRVLRRSAQADDGVVMALEAEVNAKKQLQIDLERDLDTAIGDATQAEAEMRVARARYEEAQTLGAEVTFFFSRRRRSYCGRSYLFLNGRLRRWRRRRRRARRRRSWHR